MFAAKKFESIIYNRLLENERQIMLNFKANYYF
jgi:hypothetical protein